MEDAKVLPSSSTTRDGNRKESNGKKHLTRGRRTWGGFSAILSHHDLGSLEASKHVDEPSPKGVLDDSFICNESDCTSNSSTSSEGNSLTKDGSKHWRDFLKTLKKGPNMWFYTFPLKNVPKLTRRKSRRIRGDLIPGLNGDLETELSCFQPSWKNFTLSELKDATDNFSHDNLIGEGGCAEVYKGKLPDGSFVAVKRLTRGAPEEMTADFLSELGIIVHVDHPNIAKVIGYGVEGGMHIILHLSPHGSLASLLYNCKEKLNWETRLKVAVGTAEGLMYLHKECQRRIIHKDIKAANILLSEDFDPQISDFGLAKWLPDQWSHHVVSQIEGTFGYLPPEYFMHGIVDEKTDVYAYGVLLLELITGRKAIDSSQQSLVKWARPLIAKESIDELVDPCLCGSYDSDKMERLIMAASLCSHQSSTHRPDMSQVVRILKGDKEAVEQGRHSKKPSLRRTYSEELYVPDEYDATKYLSDMDRYMQVVLDRTSNYQEKDNVPCPEGDCKRSCSSNNIEEDNVTSHDKIEHRSLQSCSQ